MDTIIFAVLLVTGIQAARGVRPKTFNLLFLAGFILTAILFRIHVTDHLNLNF